MTMWGVTEVRERLAAEQFLDRYLAVVERALRANAARFDRSRGDDSMTLGFGNYRNVGNLLEREFAADEDVTCSRPSGSYQVTRRGYVLHQYGLPTGNVQDMAWDTSATKLGMASANSTGTAQDTFDTLSDLEPAFGGLIRRGPAYLVLAHHLDLADGAFSAYLGWPRDNRRGGSPWLEVLPLRAPASFSS